MTSALIGQIGFETVHGGSGKLESGQAAREVVRSGPAGGAPLRIGQVFQEVVRSFSLPAFGQAAREAVHSGSGMLQDGQMSREAVHGGLGMFAHGQVFREVVMPQPLAADDDDLVLTVTWW